MKNTQKILLCILCIAAVAAASVMGTLAYLTDTDSAVNTFTVGNVEITLDETKVGPDGKPVDEDGDGKPDDRVRENEYHLLPGMEYTKDPMITMMPDSERSYVRMILTVHNAGAVQAILDNHPELGDYSNFLGGWDDEIWLYETFTTDTEANTISFEFRYFETPDGEYGGDGKLPPLFDTLIVPGVITGEELKALYNEEDPFKMTVEGHAIQAMGFEDTIDAATGEVTTSAEDNAWAAFDAQYASEQSESTQPTESSEPSGS